MNFHLIFTTEGNCLLSSAYANCCRWGWMIEYSASAARMEIHFYGNWRRPPARDQRWLYLHKFSLCCVCVRAKYIQLRKKRQTQAK